MKIEDIKVGKVYRGDDTIYRVDEIHENGRISATPLVGPHMGKSLIGRRRHSFTELRNFARWVDDFAEAPE